MGFVYNNVWEGFTKTYFEMNGYFVLTNLFAALLQPDDLLPPLTEKDTQGEGEDNTDAIHRALEADLVAGKFPGTNLLYQIDKRAKYHSISEPSKGEKDPHPAEFFPDNWKSPFVYTEVRANLARNNAPAQIQSLLDEQPKIETKRRLIAQRFGVNENDVLILVAGFEIRHHHRQEIQKRGWQFKTFHNMYRFMRQRFATYDVKLRVHYNDPTLEMFRFLERMSLGNSRGSKDGID